MLCLTSHSNLIRVDDTKSIRSRLDLEMNQQNLLHFRILGLN